MRELRLREVKGLAKSHTVSHYKSQVVPGLRVIPSHHFTHPQSLTKPCRASLTNIWNPASPLPLPCPAISSLLALPAGITYSLAPWPWSCPLQSTFCPLASMNLSQCDTDRVTLLIQNPSKQIVHNSYYRTPTGRLVAVLLAAPSCTHPVVNGNRLWSSQLPCFFLPLCLNVSYLFVLFPLPPTPHPSPASLLHSPRPSRPNLYSSL